MPSYSKCSTKRLHNAWCYRNIKETHIWTVSACHKVRRWCDKSQACDFQSDSQCMMGNRAALAFTARSSKHRLPSSKPFTPLYVFCLKTSALMSERSMSLVCDDEPRNPPNERGKSRERQTSIVQLMTPCLFPTES